tara:strand:+ start:494 stop:709 length:216 start_codon:yes stop_codon:yes gene_type:complete
MNINKCLVCGSTNLRADRALSGRLVCNSCGIPIGIGRRRMKKNYSSNLVSLNKKYIIFICILIFAFVLVII